jgi:hypothetical protein
MVLLIGIIGIDPKKLVKEGHVILEEFTVVFGHN